jgi:membrane peptidoglycan carboxypeptidase
MIEVARSEEPVYADPAFKINAPHFVFYVLDSLQKEGFKDGNPLTLEEIETQGYKIYTTLDLDLQNKAENAVKNAVDIYGATYGADNAGLVTIDPTTGEVLAMVGSYNYFGKSTPANCIVGLNCKFEPQVNVVDSLQAYGSTLKPIIYYQSFMNGTITPESTIVDAPIKIGNYTPKNYDGKFSGVQTARSMLVNSRNIPAIILLDKITVPGFVNILKDWGYTTMTNPNGYGLSLAVGGGEITLLEHAQAYGILANNGILTTNNVVAKIVDSSNQTIYSSSIISRPVADPRGIYMVNDILNGRNSGPGFSFDGRDVAGKTGTSEDQKETLYVAYSPEFVVAGILVNNDNSAMRYGATGFTSVRPWVGEYLKEIGSYFPATDFSVPTGLEFPPNGDILIKNLSRQQKNVGIDYSNYINRRPTMD